MATRLPNGKYRAQVYIGTDESGKRLYKSFVEETADEAEYAALTYKLGKGKRTDAKAVTLRAAMDAYIQSKEGVLAMSTIVSYKRIARSLGDSAYVPLTAINTRILQKIITDYAARDKEGTGKPGKVSAKTVKNAYALISAVLHQNNIYIHGVTTPQRAQIEYATPFGNELARIFEAAKGTDIEVAVLLAACCSLRRSEVLGLTFGDINFANRTARIRRAKVFVGSTVQMKLPKNETSTRTVYIPEFVIDKIAKIPRKNDSDPVVDMLGNTLTEKFTAILKSHNLPRCRFHDLRHAFVSVLAEQGVDAKYIQEMGGWSSPRVVNAVYKQTSLEAKKRIAENAESIFLSIMQQNATDTVKKD